MQIKSNIRFVPRRVFTRKTLLLLSALIFPVLSNAQCAMCRAVLENNGDTSMAEGINDGIVYLMAIPYLIVGVLFFFIYRKMRG